MEHTHKQVYMTPTSESIEVALEAIICDSGEVPDMEHGWDLDF